MCVCVCMYACARVCVCVCVCVCVYVYSNSMCTYTYTHKHYVHTHVGIYTQRTAAALNISVLNGEAIAHELRHSGPNSKAALETHSIDMTTYALTAILTVETIALGALHVGTFSSNVFRLAYELALAEGRVVADACSLDVLWHASP